MARQWAFAAVYLFGVRAGVRLSAARSARRGESGSPTLIVGAGKVGRTIAARFRAQRSVGLTPIGFLDKEPLDGMVDCDLPVLGASWDLEDVVRAHQVEHVVIAFSTAQQVRIHANDKALTQKTELLSNDAVSPLFQAVIEATEEAVYNSMFRATTMTGHGHTVEALPIEKTTEILKKYRAIQ